MFAAFPLWWALGVGSFIWPILAVPLFISLLRQRPIQVPRGFILWFLFLFWMVGSFLVLDDVEKGFPFIYRVGTYAAATVVFLYLYNAPRDTVTDRRVVLSLGAFWMTTAAGGFLGSVMPRFGFVSLVERLLPARFIGNDFVYQMVHPAAAQISTFLGYEAPRPKAPFEYTNDWGAVFALTTPFIILAWNYERGPLWRWATRILLILATVPVVQSLNRGLWLSLGLGLVYAAARFAAAGRMRPVLGVVVGLALVTLLVLLTPLRGVIEDRLDTPHSNEGRASLYLEATRGVLESPILGFGSPATSEINPNLPAVGTQGQLWLVLYSHGVPGLVFYLGWFLFAFFATRRGTSPLALWCNVVIFISLVQLPFYGHLAAQIQVIMVAAALSLRQIHARDRYVRERRRRAARTPAVPT
jgi:hypothetical protein